MTKLFILYIVNLIVEVDMSIDIVRCLKNISKIVCRIHLRLIELIGHY